MSDEDVKPIRLEDAPPPEPPKPDEKAKQWADRWLSPLAIEIFTVKPPKRDWLFKTKADKGVFPTGIVGMIAAEGGAGKTMGVVQLALSVATGAPWLGTFTIPTPGRVLLILGEEDHSEVQRRLYNAGNALRLSEGQRQAAASRIAILPLQGVPSPMVHFDKTTNKLVDSDFLTWLREQLAEPSSDPWRLIVVDPLSRFAGLDAEKDNAAATRFIQALESLATQTKAGVLVCHHTNKMSRADGAQEQTGDARGASGLTDGVRWVCRMSVEKLKFEADAKEHAERLGRIATLAVTKSNVSMHPPPVTLRYDGNNGGALLLVGSEDKESLELIKTARKKRKTEQPKPASAAEITRRLEAEKRALQSGLDDD